MKNFSLLVVFLCSVCIAHAQVTNVRQSVWSDAAAWSTNAIPGTADDVILNFDIVIDIDAYCRSFTLNGHNVTVNTGAHLYITGIANDADTLLARYIEIDTTTSPPDTFQTIDFYYDNLKRNTSYVKKSYSASGNISSQSSRDFYYNGDSRLPYMSSTSNGGARFFGYQNGRLVFDSSINYVYKYTYLPGAVIKQTRDAATSLTTSYTSYVEYDSAGNITHQVDTTPVFGVEDFSYVFDGHPNPFSSTQLNCWRVLNQPETFIEESFAKSNMLYINQYNTDITAHHYEAVYRYGYKANGYPKEIWAYDPANPVVPGQGKGIFIYTR